MDVEWSFDFPYDSRRDGTVQRLLSSVLLALSIP